MTESYSPIVLSLTISLLMFWAPAQAIDEAVKNELGLSPTEAAEARRMIVVWLECDDCMYGELEAVLKLGQMAVPTLAAVLKEGPSPAKLEWLRRKLLENYKTTEEYLKARPKPEPISMSSGEYVAHYLANYILRFKVRAAIALGKIGGVGARSALKEALANEQSDTVIKTVKEALANMD